MGRLLSQGKDLTKLKAALNEAEKLLLPVEVSWAERQLDLLVAQGPTRSAEEILAEEEERQRQQQERLDREIEAAWNKAGEKTVGRPLNSLQIDSRRLKDD